jgi:hypothetical protein
VQERQRFAIAVLPILGEPPTTIEPSERAFDDPAFWQDYKSVRAIGTFDDLHRQMRANLGQSGGEFRPLIAGIGEQLLQKRIHPEQGGHDENATVAILNVGRMHNSMQQQAYCIDQNMPLLALDFLARIVTRRIDADPPFSALFTLWLSMMAALGLTSRSDCSRHCS